MSFIHLSHSAKPYGKSFWVGDFSVAESWLLSIPRPPAGRVVTVFWKKPPHHWVKVNTDGAFCHFSKRASAGRVIRDEDGRILKGY